MITVFDYDGTLHKTDAIYGYAVRRALRELPFQVPEDKLKASDEELSCYLGVNAADMWKDFYPGLHEKDVSAIIKKVGLYMREGISLGRSRLYKGAKEVLDTLQQRGHTLVILSNCTISYMDAQRSAHRLDRWFSGYYCSEAYGNAPKEEIFYEIKKDFPGEYVMIGDRKSDIFAAACHGIKSVGCAYGYGGPGELEEADCVIEDIRDITGKITAGHLSL